MSAALLLESNLYLTQLSNKTEKEQHRLPTDVLIETTKKVGHLEDRWLLNIVNVRYSIEVLFRDGLYTSLTDQEYNSLLSGISMVSGHIKYVRNQSYID